MCKKIISLVLTLSLVLSMVPVAFAAAAGSYEAYGFMPLETFVAKVLDGYEKQDVDTLLKVFVPQLETDLSIDILLDKVNNYPLEASTPTGKAIEKMLKIMPKATLIEGIESFKSLKETDRTEFLNGIVERKEKFASQKKINSYNETIVAISSTEKISGTDEHKGIARLDEFANKMEINPKNMSYFMAGIKKLNNNEPLFKGTNASDVSVNAKASFFNKPIIKAYLDRIVKKIKDGEQDKVVNFFNVYWAEEKIGTVLFTTEAISGISGTDPDSLSAELGDTIKLPNNPYKLSGYTFKGWSDGTKTYDAGSLYVVNDDFVTLEAVWKKNSSSSSSSSGGGVVLVPQQPANTKYYDDIDNHWAKDAINALTKKGIIKGNGTRNFNPDLNVTREEIAVIMVRVLGLESRLANYVNTNFADNSKISSWAKASVALCCELGIFKGYDGNVFNPGKVISRQELISVILRATLGNNPVISNTNYTDNNKIEDWAKPYIANATNKGIVKGYEDGSFKPLNSVTKAEAVMMIYNYLKSENKL